MGTVVDKLNYLKETKTAIKNALVNKGVSVTDSDTFRSYAQKVVDIPVGGGDIDTLIDRSITEINSNVTTIGEYAFYRSSYLVSANFPNATSIEQYAFYGCSKIKSLNAPKLTSIKTNAFYGCEKLTSVDFPLVTSIGSQVFTGCYSLTSISFSLITIIESYTFRNCIGLTSVDFPKLTNIKDNAFTGCTSLTTLYIGTESETVCTLSSTSAFNNCSSLTDIYVPEALVDSYKSATNWSNFADKIKAYTGKTV